MYESFYNLRAKPFQLSPDPGFFFDSRNHRRAMSYLRYGLTQGEGFIVITGDVGTGKTMLVKTLFADIAKENILAAQLVTTQLEGDDLLKMAAASYGLPHEGMSKASLLRSLESFLTARAREGKRVLLVVDEAQNLPFNALEELRMLSNFQVAGQALLQSFLLGQEEFRATLQGKGMEQLRQRIIAAYHLNPLAQDETKSYIYHRLQRVGWSDDPYFTDESLDLIHQYTKGIPRRINTLADRLLLFGYLEEIHNVDADVVKTVVAEMRTEVSEVEKGGDLAEPDVGEAVADEALLDRIEALEKRVKTLESVLRKRSVWYAITGNK